MKYSHGIKLGTAALAVADVSPFFKEGWLITRINVPVAYRGRGHARELLRRVLADADAERVPLYLEISPSDGLGFTELRAWYERHGFKRISRGDYRGLFLRRPA